MAVISKQRKRHLYDWQGVGNYAFLPDSAETRRFGKLSSLSSLGLFEVSSAYEPTPWVTLEDLAKAGNSSLFATDLQQILDASSSQGLIEQEHVEEFDDRKRDALRHAIVKSHFEAGEDNEATLMFDELLSSQRMKDAALKFIQGFFVDMYKTGNVSVCVKILTMLGFYSYNELFPFSQAIALASISNKSPRVTSAAINLFAHWGNKEALSLLNNIAEPAEPWIRMKYLSVKKSLEEKCSILGK